MTVSVRRDDFVVLLDLLHAYFNVKIDPQFWRFLRFRFWGKLFQFNAMLFGLSPEPSLHKTDPDNPGLLPQAGGSIDILSG